MAGLLPRRPDPRSDAAKMREAEMKIVRVEATALRIPVGFERLGVDHTENAALTYVAAAT